MILTNLPYKDKECFKATGKTNISGIWIPLAPIAKVEIRSIPEMLTA